MGAQKKLVHANQRASELQVETRVWLLGFECRSGLRAQGFGFRC
jgi:hypothetical protein